MSAQRLALSNFLRNGPRLTSLPHHNSAQAQNEAHNEDEENAKNNGRLVETVLPLVSLLNSSSNSHQFTPNLNSAHWIPPLVVQYGANGVGFKLRTVPEAAGQPILLPTAKPKTAEVSVQTECSGESSPEMDRIDRLKWDLENKIGEDCMEEGLVKEAVRRFHKAADNGSVDGMYNLADCLYNGIGVRTDQKEAYELWKQAASFGDSKSMFALAQCFLRGAGIAENTETAMQWMRKAAGAGNSDAAFYLVVRCMRDGIVDKIDNLVAIAARDEGYCSEMQSWLRDECLDEKCHQFIGKQLSLE